MKSLLITGLNQSTRLTEGNRFEMLDQIPLISVQFFTHLLQQQTIDRFKFTLQILFDLLKLTNVSEIIQLIS